MAKKQSRKPTQDEIMCKRRWNCDSGIYGLGWLGAVIYYISTATSFWGGVLGFLKAIVWPAFLVYELLKLVAA